MTQIITGAPIWVWPLLALLVLVGLRARQDRTVHVGLIYALPLLGVLAVRSTAALGAPSWIWVIFAIAYFAGGLIGYWLQCRWIVGRISNKVQLAGENVTLTVMMIVFWANFVTGLLLAIAPDVYASAPFVSGFAAILALCGGSFTGRALRVIAWQTTSVPSNHAEV